MTVTYVHHGDHAAVSFSGALDWDGATELVEVGDVLIDHYYYSTVELTVTSPGGSDQALEHVLAAMRRWEGEGVRLVTRAVADAWSAGALIVALGAERVASPRARLRLHRVSATDTGAVDAALAGALEDSLSRLDTRMVGRLVERAMEPPNASPRDSGALALPSDRQVLDRLAGRTGSKHARSRDAQPEAEMLGVARELSERVEAAVGDGNRQVLEGLYLDLFAADLPVSAELARTLRLVDRVVEGGAHALRVNASAASETLLVPEWRALYPPEGAVPVAVLTRHTLALGETGSGKSVSAVLPVLAAAVRAPRERVGAALVIDPKRELMGAVAALAPERLRPVRVESTVLDIMQGERWSLEGDLGAGRYVSAAMKVIHRLVSFVPDIPAQVVASRPASRDPYWDLEGTELLTTVLSVLLMLLRPGAPGPSRWIGHDAPVRAWVAGFERRAGEVNLIALAAWALRSDLMGFCAKRADAPPVDGPWDEPSSPLAVRTTIITSGASRSRDNDWLFGRLALALLSGGEALGDDAREVLERVASYWEPLARVERTFAGVLGTAVASCAAFAAPAVAGTIFFGVEPALRATRRERVDFTRAVSSRGDGSVFVFQPARDQLDRLVAVALKASFFEAVLTDPDRVRGDAVVPLAFYVADEFQKYITSDAVSGEQSFFDTARSHRAACVVACQSIASLEHALSHGAGGAVRDAAALDVLWANTATKMVFRTTDTHTARRLEDLCPRRPGLVDVARARPPSTLGVGEAYAVLADGRVQRRQLDPLVLEPVREAQTVHGAKRWRRWRRGRAR